MVPRFFRLGAFVLLLRLLLLGLLLLLLFLKKPQWEDTKPCQASVGLLHRAIGGIQENCGIILKDYYVCVCACVYFYMCEYTIIYQEKMFRYV